MVRPTRKLKSLITVIVDYLNNYYRIDRVILFGSRVSGGSHKYSDIDLAVVSPDFENKKPDDLLKVFSRISLEISPDIEIHPFSLKDIKEARPTNFIGYILETGRVVYKSN